MATISGIQGSWQIDLVVNETSPNIESNTSSANWSLIIRRTDSGSYPMYGTPTINISISGKIAYNDSQYFAISSINKDGVILLSGTVTDIEHNDNGMIINNTASFTWSGAGFSPNSVSASGTYSTATIPRASSISVSNYDLGQNISITIGKKVGSFTSTLTYKIGDRTGTIAEKTSITPYVWEMPEELISQIKQDNPNNAKPSMIIYCETYSGDTKIGDTKSTTFTLIITDKPTIDNILVTETMDAIKQYTTSIVKYLSAPQFNITAIPSEGTTIATYRVKINDREITSSTNGLTVNNIQYSYLVEDIRKTKFIVTVTDARENVSDEYPIEFDFIEYVQLAFNNTDVKLTRLNGTSNFIKLHITGYIYNGLIGTTQNTLRLQYQYKQKNNPSAEWSDLKDIEATLNEDNTFIIDNLQIEDEFDYRENYDIAFWIKDLLLSNYYQTTIKTSETIAKWHKNGAYIKEIDTTKLQINGEDVFNIDKVYPIGSLYLTVDGINPKDLFGGTWEKLEEETFLMSASSTSPVTSKGGSNTHTITQAEMPVHSHGQNVLANAGTGSINGRRNYVADEKGLSVYPNEVNTMNAGGGQAFDIRPKFYAIYIWIRTS